jgi:gluconolactonase
VTSTEGQTEATDSDTQTTTTGTDETSTGTPTDTGAGGAGGATGAASEDEPTEDAGAGGMGGGTAVDPDDMATGGRGGMQDEGNGGEPGMDDPTPEVSGGASAAAICEAGASYGDPLEGMGQVIEIGPPTMGDVTYFAFIEGPIWHAGLQTLFFSDNASSPQERIFSLTPPSETPEVFMDESGSNGLALDNDDLLLLADQRNKRIVRVDPNTAMVIDTVVPEGDYTPNDLIMRSDDNLYFTDPNSAGRGFYRVSPEGQIDGPFKEVGSPNGILLSTDETTLYVGDVQNRTITAFAVAADGSVDAASATLFATTTGNTVDGMATDCAGNLYASTAEGVEVFAPDGSALGSVPTGESSNATFGGTDRKTLYVTSRALLKAVTLGVPGLPN